jgi:hypothetical protein
MLKAIAQYLTHIHMSQPIAPINPQLIGSLITIIRSLNPEKQQILKQRIEQSTFISSSAIALKSSESCINPGILRASFLEDRSPNADTTDHRATQLRAKKDLEEIEQG